MYVLDVIPLSRTAPGVLSYRSSTELPVGSVVDITLRKTPTQGIVVSCMSVTDAKEMLKHARFLLSKSAPAASGKLPDVIMQAVERVALHHAATPGAVLAAVFGEYIKNGTPLPVSELEPSTGFVQSYIELAAARRAEVYREHITSEAATLLVVPTIAEVLYWKKVFAPYKPLVLSGALTPAQREKSLQSAISHTGLIIATPSFSWTPIAKLGCIIVDRVSAGTYTLPKRPYLSIPQALGALAEAREAPFVLGDFPLPLEYRTENQSIPTLSIPIRIHDARRDPDDQEDAGPWRALPAKVIESIQSEIESGGRVTVLAVRKGYAPAVICRDCSQAQTDDRGIPLSFTQANGKRAFVTNDGLSTVDPSRACPRCGSWNLLPLGVGIERVEEELRAAFPTTPIIVAASDSLTTPRKAQAVVAESQVGGTITIGTEALLPWLSGSEESRYQPLGVIASADSLLALPFWRARERFVRLSYMFSGLCRELTLLTRHPEDAAVGAVQNPGESGFWEEERGLRKILQYPPHGTLITLTIEGTVNAVDTLSEQITTEISLIEGIPVPAQVSDRNTVVGSVRRVLVLTLPEGAWPHSALSTYISSLPPSVRIRIDPESIW